MNISDQMLQGGWGFKKSVKKMLCHLWTAPYMVFIDDQSGANEISLETLRLQKP